MVWKSGQSYSTDLRSRVLAAIDGGNPAKAVAELFQVSVSYIYKALARRAATGEIEARPQRNRQELKLRGASRRDRGRGGVSAGRHPGGTAGMAAGNLSGHGEPRPDAQDARPPRADA